MSTSSKSHQRTGEQAWSKIGKVVSAGSLRTQETHLKEHLVSQDSVGTVQVSVAQIVEQSQIVNN